MVKGIQGFTLREQRACRNDEVLIMGRKDKMETGVDPEPIPGAPKQYTDWPKREIKEPAYLKDYVRS